MNCYLLTLCMGRNTQIWNMRNEIIWYQSLTLSVMCFLNVADVLNIQYLLQRQLLSDNVDGSLSVCSSSHGCSTAEGIICSHCGVRFIRILPVQQKCGLQGSQHHQIWEGSRNSKYDFYDYFFHLILWIH